MSDDIPLTVVPPWPLSSSSPRSPGTIRMVARLTALADSADPLEDAQFNLARLRHLIGEEAPADPADMILRQGRISQEMLYAGFSVPALEQFMMMRDLLTGA